MRHVAIIAVIVAGYSTSACKVEVNTKQAAADNPLSRPAAPSEIQPPPNISAESLKTAATDDRSKAFYVANGWRAGWSNDAAAALARALAGRQRDGLDHVPFGQVGNQGSPAATDVARTRTALAYAGALARGVVDPATVHDVYNIPRPDPDLAAGLAQALRSGTVAQWLGSLAPQDAGYRALSAAYLGYRNGTPDKSSAAIPDTKPISVGDRDPRVAVIAQQLIESGYLPTGAAPAPPPSGLTTGSSSYTPQLADAVKHLQIDYGIKADGTIGKDTLEILNQGPDDKARALGVAMERRRWLSRTPPATRIDVNTAAATLAYFRDGKLIDQRKVIVGKPDKHTPALGAPLFRLVANPTWTIPRSIQHNSLSGKSGAYLRAHHMAWKNGYIVQQSGPANALGLVKFDMNDAQAIYLHDTNDHTLFGRVQRHLSHGCVRVDDALGFAQAIAQQQGISAQWQQARQSGKETFVKLPQPIPVRLLYWNAFLRPDGAIAFRTDPYDWDPPVAKALGFPPSMSAQPKPKDIDLGP